MAKYRKKPIVIEACQWFKNGDHPKDESEILRYGDNTPGKTEGKIVRRYFSPEVNGTSKCRQCNDYMSLHGWIDTLEGVQIVCPSDWIITGVEGEVYPCKDR